MSSRHCQNKYKDLIMKEIRDIARMELQKLFYSPIAWIILILFGVQSGIQFMQLIRSVVIAQELGHSVDNITFNVYSSTSGIFNTILGNLYLYIPLLTMGLLSREFSSGSIKLLYSAPISNRQIVLGKFLSIMVFGLAMVSIVFTEVLLGAFTIKEVDIPLILTGVLGLYLVICTYAAIGLFMSSLTSYQIIAAIGTFAALFGLTQVARLWQEIEFVRDIIYWLSINGRSGTFINGLICSEDVLYFILVSGLFITFTILRLKGIREKSSKYVSLARYAGVFIIVALLGYVSTIPFLMKYHDSTRTKVNTLTPNSQEVLAKLKGKITISSYINIFEEFHFMYGAPPFQKYDMDKYKQYRRFYPNIKMKYNYYYALPVQESFLKSHKERFKDMTLEEALKKACTSYGINAKLFKPASAYANEIDLKEELNRFVRKFTTEDGKSVLLRTFDGIVMFPLESHKTAAFKALVEDLPLVAFVTGHDERDVNNFGSRGYFSITKEKPSRHSLINNGFDFMECGLFKPVDKNINILIITDAKTNFSDKEMKNLDDYIKRGGNLVIACDIGRQDKMNPLVEQFGVRFMPGQVVEHNKGYEIDLVTAVSTKESWKLAYQFEDMHDESVVVMPGTVGISYEPQDGFKYTPVLVSDTVKSIAAIDSLGSWNELQTTDFIDNVATYSLEKEEVLGPITTALALSRKLEGKEQRIMILGDADCFSNSELSRSRNGINASNSLMAYGMFYWLSDNEVPIDVRRPQPPDNEMYLRTGDVSFFNVLYKIVIPALLALTFLLIWLRRKGR